MEDKYLHELFRLNCVHTLYRDGIEGVFEMEPTESGRKVLTGYGLHLKKEGGFVVAAPFSRQDENGHELEKSLDDDAKLSFAVFTNDKHFFEHSELPGNDAPGDYVYYFNNLDENSRNTSLLLDVEGIRGTERVRLHARSFSFQRIGDEEPVVRDCHGKAIPKTEYDSGVDELKNRYLIDLTRKGDGLYTIEYNNESTTYYCAKASFIRRVPLAVVEIFTAPDVSEKYRVVKTVNGRQYIDRKEFKLHFGIYSLYWRYRIIPEDVSVLTSLKVKTNNEAQTFSPACKRVNLDQDPLVFTSDSRLNKHDEEIETGLYRIRWFGHEHCWCLHKYFYCDSNFGIFIEGEFMCRKYSVGISGRIYSHYCPARCEDQLLGRLPKPDEVKTEYYYEDDKYIAEMTLHLSQGCQGYVLSGTASETVS